MQDSGSMQMINDLNAELKEHKEKAFAEQKETTELIKLEANLGI